MSLYSSNIQLLPRLPRSAFSIGPESTRATLPNFQTVEELAQFVDRLNNWRLHVPHIRIQAILGSTFIFFIIIVVGLILVRRMYENKFWLIRVIRRNTGVILVPNPTLAFLIMSAIYGMVFTPLFLVATLRYADHSGPPSNILLWFALPNLPLAFGLVYAIIGTFFAIPEALPSNQDESLLALLLRRPHVANSLGILFPILMAVAVIVPAAIANAQCIRAFAREDEWVLKYGSMTDFTQEMVQEAQLTWWEALGAAKACSIVFIIWTIFALGMCIAYLYVSFTLIKTVRRDLARAKKLEVQSLMSDIPKQQVKVASTASQVIAQALEANKMPERKGHSGSRAGQGGRDVSSKESVDAAARHQRKSLEQALFQIFIQLLVIAPGSFLYAVISLTFALTLYSKLEQPSLDGGNQLEPCIGGLLLTLMYTICLIGGANILTVAYTTLEPLVARQAAETQIRFQDVAKGPAHIRSTFFEPLSQRLYDPQVQHRHNQAETAAAIAEVTAASPWRNAPPPLWDIEADLSWHNADTSPLKFGNDT